MARDARRDRDDGSEVDAEPAESMPAPGRVTPTSRLRRRADPEAIALQFLARIGVAPVQRSIGDGSADLGDGDAHAIAERGLSGGGGALPHLDVVQRAVGHHDVSGVRAHVGGAAADASRDLGAHAYASGDEVAFAEAPDLFLVAHDAAPVVQQRGGVQLAGGGAQDQATDAPVRPDRPPRADGMPEVVQRKMERAFGADFSTVTVHAESPRATELGALAYTQGETIHFAPGQYAPETTRGQELLGHELTHVLQQRDGRVDATAQAKDAAINDSSTLEREADELGRGAAAGQTGLYHSASLGVLGRHRAAHASGVVQRAVDTRFGTFRDVSYRKVQSTDTGKDVGVEMYLTFNPNEEVDATAIGLSQAVRSANEGQLADVSRPAAGAAPDAGGAQDADAVQDAPEPSIIEQRSIPEDQARPFDSPVRDDDAGFHIDQLPQSQHPVYGIARPPAAPPQAEDDLGTPKPVRWLGREGRQEQRKKRGLRGEQFGGLGTLGYRFKDHGRWKRRPAKLHDTPALPDRGANAEQIFETTAIARKGNQEGTYYGSVSWGWRSDAAGNFTILPLTLVSEGVPSSTFLKSAEVWNKGKSSHGLDNFPLPVVDVHVTNRATDLDSGGQVINLPAGTRVRLLQDGSPSSGPPSASEAGEREDSESTESGASSATEAPQQNGRVRVHVVDGLHTGREGTVDRSALVDER
jgi:hypothetical protein